MFLPHTSEQIKAALIWKSSCLAKKITNLILAALFASSDGGGHMKVTKRLKYKAVTGLPTNQSCSGCVVEMRLSSDGENQVLGSG